MSPRARQRAVNTAADMASTPSISLQRATIPATAQQPRVIAPSVSSGDLALFALPADVTGRLVIALPLLLVADLFLPWIILGEAHVAPASAGALALLVALALAMIAAMTVYLPFRQRPILAAIPLVIAALALGGGLILLVMTGPFGGHIMSLIDAGTLVRLNNFIARGTSAPIPGPMTLAPDIGLYAFVAGAIALVVACYRRLEMLIASQYITSAQVVTAASETGEQGGEQGADNAHALRPAIPAPVTHPKAAPAPMSPLPGTPGWTQTPELPGIVRNGPPIRGLRRIDPRG